MCNEEFSSRLVSGTLPIPPLPIRHHHTESNGPLARNKQTRISVVAQDSVRPVLHVLSALMDSILQPVIPCRRNLGQSSRVAPFSWE